MENITLDPEYEKLILEVNELKSKAADKMVERDRLMYQTIPIIESKYSFMMRKYITDKFNANLKLKKVNRKKELYESALKKKKKINEEKINDQVDIEFDDIEDAFLDMQEESIIEYEDEEDYTEDEVNNITMKVVRIASDMYSDSIKKLSPTLNLNNTELENQLYDLLIKAYRELDLDMLGTIQHLCEENVVGSDYVVGDVKALKEIKKRYNDSIKENEKIIAGLKKSETFDKRAVLEDNELMERVKNNLKDDTSEINKEIKKVQREIRKIKKDNQI